MEEQNDALSRFLNPSNFATLAANAKKAVPNQAQLMAASDTALRTQLDHLNEYAKANPNGKLVSANKGFLAKGAGAENWVAGPGDFSVASAYGWSIGGGVPFLGEVPLAFLYGGKGDSWAAWATGTAVVMGSFVVDPQIIVNSNDFHTVESPIGFVRKGTCTFTASGGGAGISEVNISFYSNSGTLWGSLHGSGALIGYFNVEGTLDLVWQGWKPS